MLILSRRTDESVFIGDDIEITVLGIKGSAVKIGIRAPDGISILREELLEFEPDTPGPNSDRQAA